MTVFLRAVWGPFAPTEDKDRGIPILDWYFFGIRENHTMGRWSLRFRSDTRKFKASGLSMPEKPPLPELVGAFVPNQPMIHGHKVTDILRSRLSDADMARATALVLKGR